MVANARQRYACWKGEQCRGDRGGREEGAGAEEKGEQDVEECYCEDPWSSGGTWSVKGTWKSSCTIRMIPICCGEGSRTEYQVFVVLALPFPVLPGHLVPNKVPGRRVH